jgi:hypothetical protein
MAPSKRSGLEVNPLLSRLLSAGAEVCVFRGYVGHSDKEGSIRVYPTLGCLSFSIEIGLKDIVETAPAPTTILPHNGTIIWVRSDAEVVFHGDTVTTVPVRSLRRPGEAAPIAETAAIAERHDEPGHIDIVRGRLRISVPVADRSAAARRSGCDVCASCRGCASCTSVCQSGPA